MNLSHDQEQVVKSTAEALSSWRQDLGSTAWVMLGCVLVAALTVAAATLAMLLSRRRRGVDRLPAVAAGGSPSPTFPRDS